MSEVKQQENETKLPDINNNKGEPDAFVGSINGGSKQTTRNMEGVSNHTKTMSRHSSRQSMTNNLNSAPKGVKPARTLKNAKEKRLRVERDAELLANRIALLKQEEMRTWKKIEETRKRAKDVLEMKKNRTRTKNKKISEMRAKSLKIKKSQRRVKKLRQLRAAEKGKIREALLTAKRNEFKNTKLEGKRNTRIRSEMMRRNLKEKQKQSLKVKDQLKNAEMIRK